jgi:hypothetical protein
LSRTDGLTDTRVYQEVAGAKLTSKQKPNLFVAAMEVYERVEDDLDLVGVIPQP